MTRNIYYLCPSNPNPCGGIQTIHQHVDALNQKGFSAYVLHDQEGYQYPWKKNQTPIAYFKPLIMPPSLYKRPFKRLKSLFTTSVTTHHWTVLSQNCCLYTSSDKKNTLLPSLSDQDILVIPDYLIPQLTSLIRSFPTVLLNFTAYFTFHGLTVHDILEKPLSLPYDSSVLGCIVGSTDTANYLAYTFPQLKIYLCPFGVNTNQMTYSPRKKKQIAFMPRRCPDHLVQIISILKQRGKLKDWTFKPLEKLDQSVLVEEMQASALFLSTSYQEGFGLPPAEALSCGTLVIGYHGEGGKEFFNPPYAHPIAHGDILGYVKKVEEMACFFEENPQEFIQVGQRASTFISQAYPLAQEKVSVVKAWQEILTHKTSLSSSA